jgi:predicted nucleic acid-binding protein
MLAGIDTDFLVALTIREHDAHRSAVAFRDRYCAAVEKALRWTEAREVTVIALDVDSLRLFSAMMIERRFGRKRILDTMLAAACLEAGIHDLITGNAEHFRNFAGLKVHDFRSEIGEPTR